eukprot:GILK01002722.1.p1 GENE.GILK01002722.1~~GILK01002722.1.p1  ORF type:complete len:710 (-),score=157.14 GILK01002722.1:35-2164(-)
MSHSLARFRNSSGGQRGSVQLGKKAFKFQFNIIVHSISNVPVPIKALSVCWIRGPKTVATRDVLVKKNRMAAWEESLTLMSSLYKDAKSNRFEMKNAKFFIKEKDTAKTLGFIEVNLAEFASVLDTSETRIFPLQDCFSSTPVELKLTIQCRWVKNYRTSVASEADSYYTPSLDADDMFSVYADDNPISSQVVSPNLSTTSSFVSNGSTHSIENSPTPSFIPSPSLPPSGSSGSSGSMNNLNTFSHNRLPTHGSNRDLSKMPRGPILESDEGELVNHLSTGMSTGMSTDDQQPYVASLDYLAAVRNSSRNSSERCLDQSPRSAGMQQSVIPPPVLAAAGNGGSSSSSSLTSSPPTHKRVPSLTLVPFASASESIGSQTSPIVSPHSANVRRSSMGKVAAEAIHKVKEALRGNDLFNSDQKRFVEDLISEFVSQMSSVEPRREDLQLMEILDEERGKESKYQEQIAEMEEQLAELKLKQRELTGQLKDTEQQLTNELFEKDEQIANLKTDKELLVKELETLNQSLVQEANQVQSTDSASVEAIAELNQLRIEYKKLQKESYDLERQLLSTKEQLACTEEVKELNSFVYRKKMKELQRQLADATLATPSSDKQSNASSLSPSPSRWSWSSANKSRSHSFLDMESNAGNGTGPLNISGSLNGSVTDSSKQERAMSASSLSFPHDAIKLSLSLPANATGSTLTSSPSRLTVME